MTIGVNYEDTLGLLGNLSIIKINSVLLFYFLFIFQLFLFLNVNYLNFNCN